MNFKQNKKGVNSLFNYKPIALSVLSLLCYHNANAFLYDFKIMGIDKEPRGILNFDVKDGKHYAKCGELKRIRLPNLPECDDKDKIAVEDFGSINVNDLENVIELKIPRDKMPTSIVDLGRSNYFVDYSQTKFSTGFYANYDITFNSQLKGNEGSLWELGTDIFGWEARTLLVQKVGAPITRLNTTLSKEFKNGKIVTMGDVYSDTGGVLGPRALWGIQLRSDKDTDEEGYLLSPTVKLNGMAEASSTVEVLINGASIMKNQINEGPYSIRNISPTISGTDVKIVVTDVLGRQKVIEQSLYGDSQMLAKGNDKYVLNSGRVKLGEGIFGPNSTSGYYAYGIADNFNVRGAIDKFGSQTRYGLQLDYVSEIGRMKGTFQKNGSLESLGLSYSKGFRFNGKLLSVGTSFSETKDSSSGAKNTSESLSLGYNVSGINLGAFAAKQTNGYILNLTATSKLEKLGVKYKDWSVGLNYGFGQTGLGEKYKTFNIALSIPFDSKYGKGTASARYQNKDGQVSSGENISLNSKSGWNYGASLSGTDNLALYASKGFDKFNFKAQTSMSTKAPATYETGFSGGIIVTTDGVGFSQKATGSWAVVDAKEPGVPILINKTTVGESGSNGLLIATMPSKRNIDVELDERTAPIEIEAKSINVAAPFGKGAKVEFIKIFGQFVHPPEGFKGEVIEVGEKRFPITPRGIWVELPVGKYTAKSDSGETFDFEIKEKKDGK
jgi:outer membrane usher protein